MGPAADLARRLAQNAEAVCREYLSNGRREGGTWRVGDIDNAPGRSLMVRLTGPDSGKGICGRWVDFASGERGDLLDLIARACRLRTFRDVLEEARRFLSLPQQECQGSGPARPPVPTGSPEAARRLFASARPIPGTLAAVYLCHRGIPVASDLPALRFHPTCFYRAHEGAPRETWPALLSAVTDADGVITGVLRTWRGSSRRPGCGDSTSPATTTARDAARRRCSACAPTRRASRPSCSRRTGTTSTPTSPPSVTKPSRRLCVCSLCRRTWSVF
jgi:hypothetical protein